MRDDELFDFDPLLRDDELEPLLFDFEPLLFAFVPPLRDDELEPLLFDFVPLLRDDEEPLLFDFVPPLRDDEPELRDEPLRDDEPLLREELLRDDDEPPLRDRDDDDELRDEDERDRDDDDFLRSLAGISALTTSFVSFGICFSTKSYMRCSSRRMPLASLTVSLSPTCSASAMIAV